MSIARHWIAFAVVLLAVGVFAAREKVTIGVVSRPDDCLIKARYGDKLKLQMEGTLPSGQKMNDTNFFPDMPYHTRLGYARLPLGLEQGIMGMCAGEVRRLRIPRALFYYDDELQQRNYKPYLPPYSEPTIIYKVELLEIKDHVEYFPDPAKRS